MASNQTNGTASPSVQQIAPKGLELEITLLKGGVDGSIPAGTQFPVDGKTESQQELSQELADDLALFTALSDAVAKEKQARAALHGAIPGIRDRSKSIRAAIIQLLGKGNPLLSKFGIAPPKRRAPRSAEQLALSAAKAKLTREKHGTMSKKQKRLMGSAPTPTLTLGPDGKKIIPAGGTTGQSGPAGQ